MNNVRRPLLLLVVSVAALTVGYLADLLLNQVTVLGQHIPQENLRTDYLIGVIWAVLLGCTLHFWPVPPDHRRILLLLWLVRSLIVLGLMLLYEYHYALLDAYSYFAQADTHNSLLQDNRVWHPGLNLGTQRIRMLVSLHQHVFRLDSYHALKLSFSMVGLVAIYLFYRAAVLFTQQEHPMLLVILGLYPSVLFWSSIIGKDPVVLLGIAIYTIGVIYWYRLYIIRALVLILVGMAIVTLIRPWMGIIIGVPLVLFAWQHAQRTTTRLLLLVILVVGLATTWDRLRDLSGVQTMQDVITQANSIKGIIPPGESVQVTETPFTTLHDLAAFVPRGAFSVLFRPLPGEIPHIFGLISGIENVVLMAVVAIGLFHLRWRDLQHPVLLWGLLLILIWSVSYGFIAFYNLGAAVRFRLQILPLLLCLALSLVWKRLNEPAINEPV